MGYRSAIKKTYKYLTLQKSKTSAKKRLKKYKVLLDRETKKYNRVATPLNRRIKIENAKIRKISAEIKKL
tara:strand:+ start:7640 stop:7849 length:210 start_codon:yes stop_codon:yes gene_type:complete